MKKDMLLVFGILLISMIIASNWTTSIGLFAGKTIKEIMGSFLNPTLGELLKWNVWVGFVVIIAGVSLIFTLAQKYLSNQAELRKLKAEQKILQEEMKKYKDHPEKLLEFQKKQLEFLPRTFELTMKPMIYTSIPIILLFRWFSDYLNPIFGWWWFLYYIIGSMILSSIFKKVLNVV